MTNHSSDPEDSPLAKAMREAVLGQPLHSNDPNDSLLPKEVRKTLGRTGAFPEGKLTPHDEGELKFAVHTADGKVILDFGTPVAWLGMSPELALNLAALLIQHAQEAVKT
jgi:hypothetical protein